MNKDKKIMILSISLTLILVIIVALSFNIYSLNSYSAKLESGNYITLDQFKLEMYNDLANAYQTDKEVIKVYELCRESEIKAICVFENIDFTWSESLESIREDMFFSPTELVKNQGIGVCRDIVMFRMAIFKKLNIHANFVFEPGHVYVRVYEQGKVYELNNEYLFKY